MPSLVLAPVKVIEGCGMTSTSTPLVVTFEDSHDISRVAGLCRTGLLDAAGQENGSLVMWVTYEVHVLAVDPSYKPNRALIFAKHIEIPSNLTKHDHHTTSRH